jgi:hypothetical protein
MTMQKRVLKIPKTIDKHAHRIGIKLSVEQNEMLLLLSRREHRKKIGEIEFLVRRRLDELDAEQREGVR